MRKSLVRGPSIVAIAVLVVLSGCGRKEIVERAPVVRAVKVVTVGGDSGTQERSFPGAGPGLRIRWTCRSGSTARSSSFPYSREIS